NIQLHMSTKVLEIQGENKVQGVLLEEQGTQAELALDGVFVAIGLSPDPSLYGDLVDTTPEGYIVAGEDCRTSQPNIFVAGDLRQKEIRQIVTALGDGAVSAELAGRELR
ncbi:MAG: FAD-dependent oxidoreductase, partial [Candidatus Faecousia sp.]|nr:FAD-dependent oxidoreductase [Candidatus Faecousia sp.]